MNVSVVWLLQKQPPRGVPRKRCSENMQQIYREHPCRSVISIKSQSNFIEITLQHGCSPVNLLYIFRTPFSKNTSGWLLLYTSNLDISEATIRGVFEIALQHGFSPVNLLHIFRTLFPKNTSGPLLLTFFLEK